MEKKMTEFGVDCRKCGTSHSVMANEADVAHWQEGNLIQNVMPYLTVNDRELLISGTCGDCFDKMFPPEVDNED